MVWHPIWHPVWWISLQTIVDFVKNINYNENILQFMKNIAGIEIKKAEFISCERRIHNANYGRTNQKDEYKDYAKLLRQRLLQKG